MAPTTPGFTGKLLRVDLTNEEVSEESVDEATQRAYPGGTSIGAKVLYEEVPSGVEWSDPENRLVLATGPLGGTTIGGSGTFSVATKGALTNGATSSQANGFFGAYLKFCGYDGIIIQGAAKRWLYLHVRDGGAELRDASHLAGKDTWETDDIIKRELGYKEKAMSVFCIGPAGENLVKFAAICGDKGHIAGHNGTGAVMGSKRLKAIAVERGKRRLAVSDRKGLVAVS
ncbi:MAG: aldehyde ferredoxin oxidoreductase N-terminal domain-containing protein, partial [Chloroflexota bacterium]